MKQGNYLPVLLYLLFVTAVITIIIPSPVVNATNAEVTILNGASNKSCQTSKTCYYPDEMNIEVGYTVTWTNNDIVPHTVTSVNATGKPDGRFDSGVIGTGQTFSFTFNNSGTYNYFC